MPDNDLYKSVELGEVGYMSLKEEDTDVNPATDTMLTNQAIETLERLAEEKSGRPFFLAVGFRCFSFLSTIIIV